MRSHLPLLSVLAALSAILEGLSLARHGQLSVMLLVLIGGVAISRLLVAALPSLAQRRVVACLLFVGASVLGCWPGSPPVSLPLSALTFLLTTTTLILLLEGRGPQLRKRIRGIRQRAGFALTRPVMGA